MTSGGTRGTRRSAHRERGRTRLRDASNLITIASGLRPVGDGVREEADHARHCRVTDSGAVRVARSRSQCRGGARVAARLAQGRGIEFRGEPGGARLSGWSRWHLQHGGGPHGRGPWGQPVGRVATASDRRDLRSKLFSIAWRGHRHRSLRFRTPSQGQERCC